MLRLLAQDSADLAVVAALLQDAIILRQDMTFDRRRRQFVILLQRYRWEQDKTRTRVRSALKVDFVDSAKIQGQIPDALALLDLAASAVHEGGEDPSVALTLLFSGNLVLRLLADSLSVTLEDITDAWPARRTPAHSA
jgi:hypothetical protein